MRPRTRRRTSSGLGAAALTVLTLLPVACSTTDGARTGSTETSAPTATAAPRAASVRCNGVNEVNPDDPEPGAGLLSRSQLPTGTWGIATTPPCPVALSADELLAVP